jgi:hypothetical protein
MRRWPAVIAGSIVLAAVLAAGVWYRFQSDLLPPETHVSQPMVTSDTAAHVHDFCGKCHVYPPADTFPRSAWKEEVERGFFFFGKANMRLVPPPIDEVVRYYESRAPESLPRAEIQRATTPLPVKFSAHAFPDPPEASPPAISHVSLVELSGPQRPEILACEMQHGLVLALAPREPTPQWRILGNVKHPAHAEVVDLDGDGILDIIVADLGSFPPTDRLCGSVVWLRGNGDKTYSPTTLLKNVGRVADVQATDFNGDGKLDLVVAVFGWQEVGEIVVLENVSSTGERPEFKRHVVDTRRGAIHVPILDLNGDGRSDFVALIAQEHETVCAFINQGNFQFAVQPLYQAPHPGYGSSGIQLVDLDGDGHTDVLYSNGDTLDSPHLLKPYHGVQWLRNMGNDKLEFEHRPIAPMYGVHRAVAGDVTGDGRMDVVAVSYLPIEHFADRDKEDADAIVVFEQTASGEFVRHTLTSRTCDHVSCALGDVFGTGRLDILTANFSMSQPVPSLVVLENHGSGAAQE